jgi:cytochrome c oxidase assembly factor CtaG
MLTAVTSSLVAPSDLWRAWSADPGVAFCLGAAAVIYARAAWVARRQSDGRAPSWTMIASFVAGWTALAIALMSPLDRLGETLFAAHMAQHLMLIVVAAPLIVLGAPPSTWLWALPPHPRRIVAHFATRSPFALHVGRWLTNPPAVLVAHTAALWFWHFPRPYQAALENPWIHILEHTSFFGTAVLFWWVTLHPIGRRRLGFGAAILYVGVTLCQSGALGALLMFSAQPWYPLHAAGDALWSLTPLEDQQLAGLIMWIPAGVVYVAAASALFLQWMSADERAVRASERVPAAIAVGDVP